MSGEWTESGFETGKNCRRQAKFAGWIWRVGSAQQTVDPRPLQSTTDLADAQRPLIKSLGQIVDALHEQKPFDSHVQEWKEYTDEWRKQMPKD
jgi:hypothetical protein